MASKVLRSDRPFFSGFFFSVLVFRCLFFWGRGGNDAVFGVPVLLFIYIIDHAEI